MQRSARAIPTAFFVLLVVLAFWGSHPLDDILAPAPIAFCLVCSAALWLALLRRQLLLAVYVAQSGLACSFRSVRASQDGVRLWGVPATGFSVDLALLAAALFVAVVTVTSLSINQRRRTSELEPGASRPPNSRAWIAALILLAGCFADALATGHWTAYTGVDVAAYTGGGFHLGLFYATLLTSLVVLMWLEIVSGWAAGGRFGSASLRWSVLTALIVLLFIVQGRRYMITSLLLAGLIILQSRDKLAGVLRAPGRWLLVAGVAGLVAWGTLFGSRLWRQAAELYGDTDLALGARASLMAEVLERGSVDDLSERMTYLAMDATAIQYQDQAIPISLQGLASSALVTALPGALFPWKYDEHGESIPEACETAFRLLTGDEDLPCTPEAEALLAGGFPALLVVGVIWGGFFALLSRLASRPAFLWQLIAMVGFIPMSLVEATAFPMFQSLRAMAFVGGLVWGGAEILRLVSRRFSVAGP